MTAVIPQMESALIIKLITDSLIGKLPSPPAAGGQSPATRTTVAGALSPKALFSGTGFQLRLAQTLPDEAEGPVQGTAGNIRPGALRSVRAFIQQVTMMSLLCA